MLCLINSLSKGLTYHMKYTQVVFLKSSAHLVKVHGEFFLHFTNYCSSEICIGGTHL